MLIGGFMLARQVPAPADGNLLLQEVIPLHVNASSPPQRPPLSEADQKKFDALSEAEQKRYLALSKWTLTPHQRRNMRYGRPLFALIIVGVLLSVASINTWGGSEGPRDASWLNQHLLSLVTGLLAIASFVGFILLLRKLMRGNIAHLQGRPNQQRLARFILPIILCFGLAVLCVWLAYWNNIEPSTHGWLYEHYGPRGSVISFGILGAVLFAIGLFLVIRARRKA